jgi:hypothetical protein
VSAASTRLRAPPARRVPTATVCVVLGLPATPITARDGHGGVGPTRAQRQRGRGDDEQGKPVHRATLSEPPRQDNRGPTLSVLG